MCDLLSELKFGDNIIRSRSHGLPDRHGRIRTITALTPKHDPRTVEQHPGKPGTFARATSPPGKTSDPGVLREVLRKVPITDQRVGNSLEPVVLIED